ncbi:MAG: hypothetical protein ABA06_00315 [Parcubacteria bacterium C7867-001]|nr:MAG: hypothetical protein ABA06_00315 [Parcubacteria bacterium C7867-001]
MPKLCKRCGGAGWLFRALEKQTELQKSRQFGKSPFGQRLTRCTDCGGSGMKGKKEKKK